MILSWMITSAKCNEGVQQKINKPQTKIIFFQSAYPRHLGTKGRPPIKGLPTINMERPEHSEKNKELINPQKSTPTIGLSQLKMFWTRWVPREHREAHPTLPGGAKQQNCFSKCNSFFIIKPSFNWQTLFSLFQKTAPPPPPLLINPP